MTIREAILSNTRDTDKNNHWDKFIVENLLKNYKEDVETLKEDFVEVYSVLFGEENKVLFEEMYECREVLCEALNEDVMPTSAGGVPSAKELLRRITDTSADAEKLARSKSLIGMLGKIGSGIGTGAATAATAVATTAGKAGESAKTMLGTVGPAVAKFFGKVKNLLALGFNWVKDMVTKGASWVVANPIARIAVPLVALAGSTALAIKIINKVRNRKNKSPLTPEEESKIVQLAGRDKDKIIKIRKALRK